MTIPVYKQFDFYFYLFIYMYVKWVHLRIMVEVFAVKLREISEI